MMMMMTMRMTLYNIRNQVIEDGDNGDSNDEGNVSSNDDGGNDVDDNDDDAHGNIRDPVKPSQDIFQLCWGDLQSFHLWEKIDHSSISS